MWERLPPSPTPTTLKFNNVKTIKSLVDFLGICGKATITCTCALSDHTLYCPTLNIIYSLICKNNTRRVTYVIVTGHKHWNRPYFGDKSAAKCSIQNSLPKVFTPFVLFKRRMTSPVTVTNFTLFIYVCLIFWHLFVFSFFKHSATVDIFHWIHLHTPLSKSTISMNNCHTALLSTMAALTLCCNGVV